jgi:hypothetical protein
MDGKICFKLALDDMTPSNTYGQHHAALVYPGSCFVRLITSTYHQRKKRTQQFENLFCIVVQSQDNGRKSNQRTRASQAQVV